MSTINVYSVRNALEADGWQLVSEVYKNLKTPLEMICPAGHKQEQTFDNWRKHKLCDICMAGDPYKVKKIRFPKREQMFSVYQHWMPQQALQAMRYMMIKCQLDMELLKQAPVFQQHNASIM